MKGARAEDLARRFFEARGFKLIARNYRCKGGELDLVLRGADGLVVAEVRQRSHPDFGTGVDSVTRTKRRRLVHAAQAFLAAHPQYADSALRFDIVSLDAQERIDWLPAAFDAGDA